MDFHLFQKKKYLVLFSNFQEGVLIFLQHNILSL